MAIEEIDIRYCKIVKSYWITKCKEIAGEFLGLLGPESSEETRNVLLFFYFIISLLKRRNAFAHERNPVLT